MPRQPTLSSDSMRALFIRCAEKAITEEGVKNATARNIATRAGYTAGTLYTCFRNLDDLLIHLQISVLERLCQKLEETRKACSNGETVGKLTSAYLQFAYDNEELWALLQQNTHTEQADLSAKFSAALNEVRTTFAGALSGHLKTGGNDSAADLLWASTHGLTSVATSKKLGLFSRLEVNELAKSLAQRFNA